MSATENLELVRELLEAMRQHDVERAISYYHEDCLLDIVPLQRPMRGRDRLAAAWGMAWSGCPDQYYTEKNMFATDDYVMFEGILGGTHTGTFHNIPATGKHVAHPVAFVWRIVDGKVKEWHSYWDAADMLRQLNVIPESTRLPLGED